MAKSAVQDSQVPTRKLDCQVINLKGTQEYCDWLDAANKKTHIAKAVIVRLALAQYAAANGLEPPPEA